MAPEMKMMMSLALAPDFQRCLKVKRGEIDYKQIEERTWEKLGLNEQEGFFGSLWSL